MSVQASSLIEFVDFGTISREQLKAYADASGDFNPIHLDEEVAKKVGLPGIIAHGMLIAGMMAERAVQVVGQEPALQGFELSQFQSRFKAMLLLGDTPSVGGVIREVTDKSLILDLQTKNQRGEITTTAVARFKKVYLN